MESSGSNKSVLINGRKIGAARKTKLMTQAQLALKAGVDLNTIKRIEPKESIGVHATTLMPIAAALGVPPQDLLATREVAHPIIASQPLGTIVDGPLLRYADLLRPNESDVQSKRSRGERISVDDRTFINAAIYAFLTMRHDSQVKWIKRLQFAREMLAELASSGSDEFPVKPYFGPKNFAGGRRYDPNDVTDFDRRSLDKLKSERLHPEVKPDYRFGDRLYEGRGYISDGRLRRDTHVFVLSDESRSDVTIMGSPEEVITRLRSQLESLRWEVKMKPPTADGFAVLTVDGDDTGAKPTRRKLSNIIWDSVQRKTGWLTGRTVKVGKRKRSYTPLPVRGQSETNPPQ